jgi:hypothetical protein
VQNHVAVYIGTYSENIAGNIKWTFYRCWNIKPRRIEIPLKDAAGLVGITIQSRKTRLVCRWGEFLSWPRLRRKNERRYVWQTATTAGHDLKTQRQESA